MHTPVEALITRLDATVKYKDDKPDNWLHAVILWLGRLFISRFQTRFATTIGSTIYMPTKVGSTARRALLRHELVHVAQWQKWNLLFILSYLLVLPVGLTMRAYWELQAYTEQMYQLHHENTSPDIDGIADHFLGATYFFMFPFRTWITSELIERYRKIRYGELRLVF